jgi:hypothetical protein
VVGTHCEHAVERGKRALCALQLQQGEPEIVQRDDVFGLDRERALIARHRFLAPLEQV